MENFQFNEKEKDTNEGDSAIKRIEKNLGDVGIVNKLVSLPNTDFQSLFLEIMEEKSNSLTISDLKRNQEINLFLKSSEISQREFIKLDALAYNLLPDEYEGIELSPLAPFGTNKLLAEINQKSVLSTNRNSEVIADPTTSLALQCAQRRIEKLNKNQKNSETVSLATSQRVSRQNQLKKTVRSQHFRTFTIMSAGRDIGFENFEKYQFKNQMSFFLTLLNTLNEIGEYRIEGIKVEFSNASDKPELLEILETTLLTELKKIFPEVDFSLDIARKSNYYSSVYYRTTAENKSGERFTLIGGGMTDWTQKLVGSKKERLLFGSLGSEVLCKKFKIHEAL